MINVQDLDFKRLVRTRRVNGEKTIELDVLPTANNTAKFDLIVEEMSVNVFDDSYVIKKLNEKSIGKTYWKQSSAIHDFFVNLINKQQPRIHNGSITFNNYMQMVFEDTGYTFVVVDQFLARSFENLGNDNRLALLQKGLDRFQAEFELVGTEVRFKKQIGNDTDFQFRYGHNIKGIDKGADTTNLATVIRGTGAEGITAYYRSPNADIFEELDAPPVNDERFTTQAALLEEMKSRLQDTPEVSITVDFVDLRAAGYPYTVPSEGDRVWLIYEPMDDLLIEVRIMEIKEHYDVNLNPIRTEVTLSNYKKTFAGTMFDNIKKQLSEIVNDDGIVKYSALDEAVRIATEALHSAQTELIFDNGIIARDKTNPNKLVVYNSAGLGISDNGGNTFRTAITGDGIVADVITAGTLRGIDIIGTNIMSFNPVTNDVITLQNGEIETFVGGKKRFSVHGNGFTAYHWVDETEVASLASTHINNQKYGAGIVGYGDYFSIGKSDGGTHDPYLFFEFKDGRYINANVDEIHVFGDVSASQQFVSLGSGINGGLRFLGGSVIGVRPEGAADYQMVLYPNRAGGGHTLSVRSHSNRDSYRDDLYIDSIGDTYVRGNLSVGNSIFISQGTNPENTRYWFEYDGSDGNLEIASLNTSGTWIRRLEFEGRNGGNIHLWDRIRSQGTLDATTTNSANLHIFESSARMARTTSSRKYKIDEQPIRIDHYNILKIIPKDWYDLHEIEQYADELTKKHNGEEYNLDGLDLGKIRRIPGAVAEDFVDAGLGIYVNYNQDDEIEGLMYDRAWFPLIPITNDHEDRLNEYDDRFGTLENRVDNLEKELNKLRGVA